MGTYKEVYGNLITMANQGKFDVITHGCNCFCRMGAGIAPQMAEAFGADKFEKEAPKYRGDINKLGTIDYAIREIVIKDDIYEEGETRQDLAIVNSYSQYGFIGVDNTRPLDYEALTLCLRKINHVFRYKRIGLPLIGGGLAGGDLAIIKQLIEVELCDCNVTLVLFDPNLDRKSVV